MQNNTNTHIICSGGGGRSIFGMIGQRVSESRGNKQPKPFKSGNLVNTVKGIVVNPYTKKLAFTFEEDDSFVNCDICFPVE
jgi:hypothetical protein